MRDKLEFEAKKNKALRSDRCESLASQPRTIGVASAAQPTNQPTNRLFCGGAAPPSPPQTSRPGSAASSGWTTLIGRAPISARGRMPTLRAATMRRTSRRSADTGRASPVAGATSGAPRPMRRSRSM